jgi:hypothetical protein
MARPKIFFDGQHFPRWWIPLLEQYFDLVDQDRAQAIVTENMPNDFWPRRHHQRIVNLSLFDTYLDQKSELIDGVFYLRARDWMWINEHYWFIRQGYQDFVAQNSQASNFMLMMMNLERAHRTAMCDRLGRKILRRSLWTYLSQGKCLPEDPVPQHLSPISGGFDHKLLVPSWYNNTRFSVVVESRVDDRLFISEKSLKPLAHGHAFVVLGTQGTLSYLRSLGFATFDNEIDEMYDSIPNSRANRGYPEWDHGLQAFSDRMDEVVQQVQMLYRRWRKTGEIFNSPQTLEKIKHNHAHFYDGKIVSRLFKEQIIDQIMEVVDA